MGKTFKGDTPTKRLSRLSIYNSAVAALKAAGRDPRSSRYLVIAGSDAAEAGILRHVIKADPGNVLFVDLERRGLDAAISRWPGVRTFLGPVHEAPVLPRTAFAHLDWMDGRLQPDEVLALARVQASLDLRGAVVAWTHIGAFDHPTKSVMSGLAKAVAEMASRSLALSMSPDEYASAKAQRVPVISWVAWALSKPGNGPRPTAVELSDIVAWNTPFPMRTDILVAAQSRAVVDRMKCAAMTCAIHREAMIVDGAYKKPPAGPAVPVFSARRKFRDAWRLLCLEGKGLESCGFTREQVAAALNLTPGQWAARKARHTAGSYGEAA